MNETLLIILIILVGLFALYIVIVGAIYLFAYASEQGFIGIAVFIACWVFMFPIMMAITVIVGLVVGVSILLKKY